MKNWHCDGLKLWHQANDWAAQLADGQCGLTDGSSAGDWRLPAIEGWRMKTPADVYEELSIVDTACSPAIPDTQGAGCWSAGNPFDNVASSTYWSATSFAFGPSLAWVVNLNNGFVYNGLLKTGFLRVVAVRGGP
jgi:hypothetical protein